MLNTLNIARIVAAIEYVKFATLKYEDVPSYFKDLDESVINSIESGIDWDTLCTRKVSRTKNAEFRLSPYYQYKISIVRA